MDERFYLDENLRYIPKDSSKIESLCGSLKYMVDHSSDALETVNLMGELAFYLDSLNKHQEAKDFLTNALALILQNELGVLKEVQNKIRLASVHSHLGEYEASTEMFQELIILCEENEEAIDLLDFVLQHSAKNLFEQKKYSQALLQLNRALSIRIVKESSKQLIASTKDAIKKTQFKIAALTALD